jgi:hypothetical protein
MKAAAFVAPGRIVLEEKPTPSVGPGDALIKSLASRRPLAERGPSRPSGRESQHAPGCAPWGRSSYSWPAIQGKRG